MYSIEHKLAHTEIMTEVTPVPAMSIIVISLYNEIKHYTLAAFRKLAHETQHIQTIQVAHKEDKHTAHH